MLVGTIEEVLSRAEAYPRRQIEIGTVDDVHQPVLLHLTKSASYNDHELKAASSRNIQHAVNQVGLQGRWSGNLGGHVARRGTAQDANNLSDDQGKAGTGRAVSTALGHTSVSSLKGISNMYADGHVEHLERARETLLPHVAPLTDGAITHLNQDPQPQVADLPISTATNESYLWSLLDLADG